MDVDEENISDANLEKLTEMNNKLSRCNKNIKLVLELLEKLSKASENKTEYKPMDETTYKNKRAVYLTKLNSKEIKQPKQSTLNYYKIDFDEDYRNIRIIHNYIFFGIILLCYYWSYFQGQAVSVL